MPPGRKRIVTADAVVDYIRESEEPIATTGDLADHLDVSPQSVRDAIDLLTDDPRIATTNVVNATAFYVADEVPAVIERDGSVWLNVVLEEEKADVVQAYAEENHDGDIEAALRNLTEDAVLQYEKGRTEPDMSRESNSLYTGSIITAVIGLLASAWALLIPGIGPIDQLAALAVLTALCTAAIASSPRVLRAIWRTRQKGAE